jgi:hypothetical protein
MGFFMNAKVRKLPKRLPFSRSFLKYCDEQDKPAANFERNRLDLYLCAIGYKNKPLPETDSDFVLEDMALFSRGLKKL